MRPLAGYVGGKYYLVKTLLQLIPPHEVYVEVFGGMANLLFNKEPSKVEVYNDIDGELVNLFKVVRDKIDEFEKKFDFILYSRQIYREFLHDYKRGKHYQYDDVERAFRYFYLLNASFSGKIGGGWGHSKIINHTCAFVSKIERLREYHNRLKNVAIENLDFREILQRYDSKNTLFYLDPPYYLPARRSKKLYQYEMSDDDHRDLLKLVKKLKGKWMLSGYHNELYDQELRDYYYIEKEAVLFSQKEKGTNKEKAREVVWFNFEIENKILF